MEDERPVAIEHAKRLSARIEANEAEIAALVARVPTYIKDRHEQEIEQSRIEKLLRPEVYRLRLELEKLTAFISMMDGAFPSARD